ncbi:MAG TPA: hypothetical protein VFL29_05745 [Candidatus Dormibacteraeota bacterium]|nr:hypothetical protein [Candidatus Dormibacteraeota bacterium]
MSLLTRQTGEVSIWADDLKAGAVPWICARSGGPATRWAVIQFRNSSLSAFEALIPGFKGPKQVVRGRLPFSATWVWAIGMSRLLILVACVGFLYGVFKVTSEPHYSLATLVIFGASIAVLQLWAAGRSWLEPHGEVFTVSTGAMYVRVRGVHPNFAAAVEAWRAQTVGPGRLMLTPDGKWWWDGSKLFPVSGMPSAPRRVTPQALMLFSAVAVLWFVFLVVGAWTRFHS